MVQGVVNAQTSENSEIENLYQQTEDKQVSKVRKKRKRRAKRSFKKQGALSELSDLEPLADIAVMQRRYLPTSERFEFSTLLAIGTNNTYFNNLGAAFKLTYFMSTKHGVEGQYYALSPSKKEISNDLESYGVKPFVASANSYMGLAYKYTPIYGKTAWRNSSIYAYDTYVVIGGGITGTDEEDAPTIHLGLGQNFAVSKSLAFTLDVSMNSYSATATSAFSGGKITSTQSDIFVSLGASFYFPEATYR